MRRLYHQPLSPFCRKIRLVLAEKKIEVELVEERTWERRMDFLRMNPAGQVPVLKIDGLVLANSSAIFEYLEETNPEPPLLPRDPALRAEARRLTAWFDDKFHNEVTANLLYERVNKKLAKSGYPESEKIKAGTRNIKYHLDYIGWLMEHRRWLAGDMLTIADFAAAAQLSASGELRRGGEVGDGHCRRRASGGAQPADVIEVVLDVAGAGLDLLALRVAGLGELLVHPLSRFATTPLWNLSSNQAVSRRASAPQRRVPRQQRRLGIGLLEVLEDRARSRRAPGRRSSAPAPARRVHPEEIHPPLPGPLLDELHLDLLLRQHQAEVFQQNGDSGW